MLARRICFRSRLRQKLAPTYMRLWCWMRLISSGTILQWIPHRTTRTDRKEPSSRCSAGPTTKSKRSAKWSGKPDISALKSSHPRNLFWISTTRRTASSTLGTGCTSPPATGCTPEWETMRLWGRWSTPAGRITWECMLMQSWIIWQEMGTTCSRITVPAVCSGERRIPVEEVHGIHRVSPIRTGHLLARSQVWRFPLCHMGLWTSIAQDH